MKVNLGNPIMRTPLSAMCLMILLTSCSRGLSVNPGLAQSVSDSSGMTDSIVRSTSPRSPGSSTLDWSTSELRSQDLTTALPAISVDVLWDVIVGSTDHMSTKASSERNLYNDQGQTWYVPTNAIAGTAALYRDYYSSAAFSDHMDDDQATAPPPYHVEEGLGNPYSTTLSGTRQIVRYYDSSDGDHATPGFTQSLPGYSPEPFPLAGYPRYNNQTTVLTSVSGGEVTAQVNSVAGASFWTWTWNGFQFLDHTDYGREMQSDLFWINPAGDVENPIEAGDSKGDQSGTVFADWHGSPVASLVVSGTTVSTSTIPLEWDPYATPGPTTGPGGIASPDDALLYSTMRISKSVNLLYQQGVASYTTSFTLPNALGSAIVEMPTAYLVGTLNQFYTFDAGTNTLTQIPLTCNGAFPPTHTSLGWAPPSGYGGVIISATGGADAMGAYSSTMAVGGPATGFGLYDFIGPCGPGGYDFNVSKWNINRQSSFSAGTSAFQTFVLTGTLQQVESGMRNLYHPI